MPRWVYPPDPECPEWAKIISGIQDDPMTAYSGVGDEIAEDAEKRHVSKCERCQMHGAENVEVE